MKLTKTQRLILYALGQFYQQLNQPLQASPLQLRTSKITFITFLLHSQIITKKERALYKNLETLEHKGLIEYNYRMIAFTQSGIEILRRINNEIKQFFHLQHFFMQAEKPKQKLQTVIKE